MTRIPSADPTRRTRTLSQVSNLVPTQTLRLALPKGRMYEGVRRLFAEAGIEVFAGARGYRPTLSVPGFETKLLKPQNIVEMLEAGSRDLGFAGADWVAELNAPLVELLDTGLDPVRVVAAGPASLLVRGDLPRRGLVVASEYEELTRSWIERRGLEARVLRSYGATEVFPPEDADVIVDNTATGSTLAANDLTILDEVMASSTRLYASREALEDPARRAPIEDLLLLLRSVLEARGRVMLELNVPRADFEGVIAILPCMDRPTVASLFGEGGFGVKAAVPRSAVPALVPRLKAGGARDIVVSRVSQIVP